MSRVHLFCSMPFCAALPRALPLYEGVPLSAQFQAKDLEGVGEQGNEGASRAGDRVIINLE